MAEVDYWGLFGSCWGHWGVEGLSPKKPQTGPKSSQVGPKSPQGPQGAPNQGASDHQTWMVS